MRDEGFDGVITPDGKYLVFEKMQIKSVDNQGTFDESNPNIYYQIGINSKDEHSRSENVYDNFVSSHKKANLIEQAPEYWSGETIENAKEFLNFGNKSSIKIKSPIEEITMNEGHLKHLIEDNNSYRKKYLNRVIRTMQNPNIILKDNDYHNYIKLFKSENDTIKPHLQIVKVKNDGSFYVTNYKPTKRQLKQLLQNEVVYDLVRNTDVENNSPANNSITDVDTNFNPKVKNNVLYNSEQQNIFPGNRKAKEIHKVKGGYLPAEKFIELFKNADASTIVHELAHWYLDELTRTAQYSEEIAQDLEAVRKYLKNEGEDFTREQHEKFARVGWCTEESIA